MIFPWQIEQWQQFLRSQQTGRLSHALLLAGLPGIGKIQFANCMLHRLLCQEMDSRGMDCYAANKVIVCHACQLVTHRTHPNVLWVEPEKNGHTIKVNQIREIGEFTQQTALQGKYNVVVVHPANSMNMNSANALLKTLEEPSLGSIIILISDQPAQLPATILSRCQRILFRRPDKVQALHWLHSQLTDSLFSSDLLLNIAHGAPLAALQLVQTGVMSMRQTLFNSLCLLRYRKEDPLHHALLLQEMDILLFIDMAYCWLMDVLRLQLGINTITNHDYQDTLTELMHTMNIQDTSQFIVYLQTVRGQLSYGANINKQLMMENILVRYSVHLS
jgi:DNA polymerase-3 subunit delta'